MTGAYQKAYDESLTNPAEFWGRAAKAVHWDRPYDRVLDDTNRPFYRWFAGGEINTCYNALDRHVQGGRADQTALIYDSPVTGT